ncbi:glycosyltransferase [Bacteroides sp. CAG:927]|nr:glycosyltransferase [Bacteroides sp. CAG:927]
MKIVYCTHSVYCPGGMERVLLNKVRWIRENTPWQVIIVTTDQEGRKPFYDFPEGVRIVDLGINYSRGNSLSPFGKITDYFHRRKLHRRRLTDFLMQERPDLTITLYPSEASFVPDIKDGSKKILEFHYSKNFRLQYNRKGLLGLADKWRTKADEKLVRRFDRFVVLTNQDARDWGNIPNMSVIPNAAIPLSSEHSDCLSRRVIAVGRLDYQKGFDRLIKAWRLVMDKGLTDWHLDIFGQGEWKDYLNNIIHENNQGNYVTVNAPVSDIAAQYTSSSLLAMSSNYEGFPMVMIEAMSCGLPVVTFDYKCGPRDIITPEVNGLIVPNGDIQAFADALARVMTDTEMRSRMGREALRVTERYSLDSVMKSWNNLFEKLHA